MEIIHANYRAQTMGEDIRGVSGVNTTTSTLSRWPTVEATKSKQDSEVENAWDYMPFPGNIGQLNPSEFYSQVKRWYAVPSKPLSAYTTSDKSFVTNFRFNCKQRTPQDQRNGGSSYDGRQRGGNRNWRNEWNDQNLAGNWRNDGFNQNYGGNQVNWSETGGQARLPPGGGQNLGERNFNASSRRAALTYYPHGSEDKSDNQVYQDFMSWRSQNGGTRSRRLRRERSTFQDEGPPSKRRSKIKIAKTFNCC